MTILKHFFTGAMSFPGLGFQIACRAVDASIAHEIINMLHVCMTALSHQISQTSHLKHNV